MTQMPPPADLLSRHPTVSVVICAYTMARWQLTLLAIESVRRQTPPVSELLLVIDHNTELLERFRAHDPHLRVIQNEEAPGLSGGRNTGVQASSGEYIAFLDDDAEAEPDWIRNMTRHLERAEVIGVGARVVPAWVGEPTAWFPDEFLWVVGCSHRGLPTLASPVRNVSGGGMLLRRAVFDRAGYFSHHLGRTRSNLPLGGEETELCIRAQAVWPGAVLIYEPDAVILHHVSTARMTWSYYFLRCYAEGLSKATLSRMAGRANLTSERRQVLSVLPRGVLQGVRDTVLRLDPGGAGRAVAIVAGLCSVVAGFVVGQLTPDAAIRPGEVH